MEGYSNSVRSVMRYAREHNLKTVHGALGQLLSVPKEYETAMDMALGAAQQNIVTDSQETAKATTVAITKVSRYPTKDCVVMRNPKRPVTPFAVA